METVAQINARWRYRRLIVLVTLLVCFAGVTYLTLLGKDTRLNETLASGFFALAGATIGSYVFGAVWDDNQRGTRSRNRRSYSEDVYDAPNPWEQSDGDDERPRYRRPARDPREPLALPATEDEANAESS